MSEDAKDTIISAQGRALIKIDARKSGVTAAKRKAFLDMLATCCNVRKSARAADVHLSTVYGLRQRDPAFAASWRQALILGHERLEEALLAYAISSLSDAEIIPADEDLSLVREGTTRARPSAIDINLALALLARHQAAVDGRGRNGRSVARATAEETDAALRKKLDMLARQLKGTA